MAKFDLPIGYYSEEAQESSHKINKSVRLLHTRKMSRLLTITDQFNRLNVLSDPLISTISQTFRRSKKKPIALPRDAVKMLISNEEANKEINLNELSEATNSQLR
jgi:hypothetical protein